MKQGTKAFLFFPPFLFSIALPPCLWMPAFFHLKKSSPHLTSWNQSLPFDIKACQCPCLSFSPPHPSMFSCGHMDKMVDWPPFQSLNQSHSKFWLHISIIGGVFFPNMTISYYSLYAFLRMQPWILISREWGMAQTWVFSKLLELFEGPPSSANFWSNPVTIVLFPLPELCLQGWGAINQSVSDQPQGRPRTSLSQWDNIRYLLRGKKELPFSLTKFFEVTVTLSEKYGHPALTLPEDEGSWPGTTDWFTRVTERNQSYTWTIPDHISTPGCVKLLEPNIMYCLCHLKFNFLPTREDSNQCSFPWCRGLRHWYGLIGSYKPAASFILIKVE